MPKWKDDAREFGLHVRQGGWRLGLLVARNVTKGNGGPRSVTVAGETVPNKVSATQFAEESGTVVTSTVLRYLAAWERAADAGHVPHTTDLKPDTEPELDVETLPDWQDFYDSTSGPDRLRDTERGRAIRAEAARAGVSVHKTDEAARNPGAVAAAIRAVPDAARNARDALTSTPKATRDTYTAVRDKMIEQARAERHQPPQPEPDAQRERVIRIEAIVDDVIRGLAGLLDPDTDPLGQRLALLEENLDALSDYHRQRLARAVTELGARVSAWEDRVRGIAGHTVAE